MLRAIACAILLMLAAPTTAAEKMVLAHTAGMDLLGAFVAKDQGFFERRGITIPKFLQQILAGLLFCIALLLVAVFLFAIKRYENELAADAAADQKRRETPSDSSRSGA